MHMTGISRAGKWYIKGWLFWVVFMLLYFVYKFFPCTPLMAICGICESCFQHFKAAYFSWIIISLLEFLYMRRSVQDRQVFLYSRMATATILPWFIFILWYLGVAIFGRLPSIALEILYANIITIIVGIFADIFEQGVSRITYPRELKTIILVLFFASLVLYLVFTFGNLPWADVFIEPAWR